MITMIIETMQLYKLNKSRVQNKSLRYINMLSNSDSYIINYRWQLTAITVQVMNEIQMGGEGVADFPTTGHVP